jgi:hexosaminidase
MGRSIEGGISPTAMIMYWRGWVPNAPVKAVKNGNPLYFDGKYDKNDRMFIILTRYQKA